MGKGIVLVTGGAGFIGSHTVRLLLERGYDVIVLDNLCTGCKENVPKEVELVVGDITDRDIVSKTVKKSDYIIHLAAIVSVDEARKNPFEATRVNVLGTLNLLEESYRQGIERFVYASSSAVYGEQEKLPIIEEAPLKPINTYGATKLAGEALVNAYKEEKGLSAITLRYFNVYGPGMRGGPYAGVIYRFIKSALEGEPLMIYGDGEQTRDFVYVGDVARANIVALELNVCGVFNIGTGNSITINELAKLILEITGSKSPIAYTDPRPGDIKYSKADITKATRLLGWKPVVELEEGLRKTIEWFSNLVVL